MYEQVILVGGSQFAKKCMSIMLEYCDASYFNTDKMKKSELMQSLSNISARTLVLSIMNPYIFTGQAIANPNLTIINLHHGILPGHRGRNAQAWSLFYEENEAGITWHLVDQGVDTGKVLHIERIPIEENDTALSLMKKQNLLALENLKMLLPQFLSDKTVHSNLSEVNSADIKKPAHDYLHRSCDIPGDGILDLSWSGHKMSCFLRAMDFGILKVLGTPILEWQEKWWSFSGYRIEKCEYSADLSVTHRESDIFIEKDHYFITLRKVKNLNVGKQ